MTMLHMTLLCTATIAGSMPDAYDGVLPAGTYRASLLRAYERTVREARFALVIVDAPNLAAEDLKPYWTAGQVFPLPHICFKGVVKH